MNERRSYSEWIFFVAGSLAGASVALLWAPRSGGDTRRRIGRRLRDAADDARELKDGMFSRGEDIQREVQRVGEETTSAVADEIGLGKAR